MMLNPFSTEAIALQQRPPALVARMVSISICLIAVCTIVYACLASMDVVVTAQGRGDPVGKKQGDSAVGGRRGSGHLRSGWSEGESR